MWGGFYALLKVGSKSSPPWLRLGPLTLLVLWEEQQSQSHSKGEVSKRHTHNAGKHP